MVKMAAQHLQPCWRCGSSSAMNCPGQRRNVLSAQDAAWYLGGIRISHSSQALGSDSGAVCEDPLLIGPTGPALSALPLQLCVPRCKVRRSCAFSMFSSQFPSAAWRGVAMSDVSSKNCDGMRSMWDLGPTISRIMKRRRTCRRRSLRVLLKSAPSRCEQVWAWSLSVA